LGVLIAAAAMAWRLSAGPVSVAYVTPYFEDALSPDDGRYAVQIDDTILDWSQEARTLNVKLIGARILDSDQAVVLQAPELYVSLSASALIRGEIAPRSLSISQPSLQITRTENGDFVLGAEGDASSARENIRWSLGDVVNGETGRASGYLERVNILHAQLALDDRMLGVKWSAPDVNISLLRTPTGINAVTDLDLTVGDRTAAIQLNADYRQPDGETTISLGISDLSPKALAGVSERLAVLDPFDVPLSGAVSVELDRYGDVVKADFNLVGGAGRIAMQAPVALDVPVERGRFRGTFAAATAQMKIEDFTLGFADDADVALPAPIDHSFPLRELTANGTWSVYANQIDIPAFKLTLDRPIVEGALSAREDGDGYSLDATVKGTGFAFDDIARYWPARMGADPRDWILKHLPNGHIEDAHTQVSLHVTENGDVEIGSLDGEILARDLVLDYLPPMPKITKGAAHAKFDAKKFDIDVLGGESAGLTVQGHVVIDDLDKKDQWTDIDAKIVGPLSGVLRTIDSPPFRFAHAVGLSPDDAVGETETRLKLRFITENRLTVDEIKVSAEAGAKGVGLPSVSFGLPLSDGDLKLTVDNTGMDVAGSAVIGGLPSELQWRENFNSKKAPFSSRYRIKSAADADVWREKAGLNLAILGPEVLSGVVAADVEATMMTGGRGTVTAEMVLNDAALSLAPLGYEKPAGEPGRASVQVTLNQGKVSELPKVSVTAKDLDIDAAMSFGADNKLARARLARFHAGETDISGTVVPQPGGWNVDVHGAKLDLKAYMEDKTPEDPDKPRGDAYTIALNVEKLRLYDERYLQGVRGTATYDGLVAREAHFTAAPAGGGSLRIDLAPQGGGRKLSMVSDNAGAVLQAFDINDNIVGGRLDIAGTYAGMVPAVCFGGRVAMDNFRVRNAPILARLLNVASIVGLVDVLRGEGIGFDTFRAPFTRKDGVTRFENAKANGLSIGLTASGSINAGEETMDIEGEVIPANVLNGLLGRIPLVGGIFGGDSGVFAISYKITGSEDEPEVSTNPLTVVTPGFTRKIFSIFDKTDDEAPPGCPKSP
jgi:hypothetical protein